MLGQGFMPNQEQEYSLPDVNNHATPQHLRNHSCGQRPRRSDTDSWDHFHRVLAEPQLPLLGTCAHLVLLLGLASE